MFRARYARMSFECRYTRETNDRVTQIRTRAENTQFAWAHATPTNPSVRSNEVDRTDSIGLTVSNYTLPPCGSPSDPGWIKHLASFYPVLDRVSANRVVDSVIKLQGERQSFKIAVHLQERRWLCLGGRKMSRAFRSVSNPPVEKKSAWEIALGRRK